MTTPDGFPSVCVPSSPLGMVPSERLAVVCPVVAPPLSPLWPAPVLPVPRVALTALDCGSPPLGACLAGGATIGGAPQTR
jgi:hypothetical protein